MHRYGTADNLPTEGFAESLVAKADAQERNVAIGADESNDVTCAGGSAGSGRDDDRRRFRAQQRVRIEGIVANDSNALLREPLDLLNKVVGE